MQVLIRDGAFEVTEALRRHVERRLGLALGRFGDRIGRVTVRFSDEGVDRRCQIEVRLRAPQVRVEDRDVDPFAATDHAADRASSSIARALERERALAEDSIQPRTGRRDR